MGTVYLCRLAKYVKTFGDSVKAVEGAGVGQARFAFLMELFGGYRIFNNILISFIS